MRVCEGEAWFGEVARGVDTAGDANEQDPLDLLAPSRDSSLAVSTELRDDVGKATAVEILSTFGCREDGPEEVDGSDAIMMSSLVV